MTRILLCVAALALEACAASPLYVQRSQGTTPDTVPRDANGNPVLTAPPKIQQPS
jgi:hypothetical protein